MRSLKLRACGARLSVAHSNSKGRDSDQRHFKTLNAQRRYISRAANKSFAIPNIRLPREQTCHRTDVVKGREVVETDLFLKGTLQSSSLLAGIEAGGSSSNSGRQVVDRTSLH